MQLVAWKEQVSAGISLTGWHSTPTGKPVLHFLHGNGFCCRTYEPMLKHLSESFDLWLCDIQGHGDSEHGKKFLGWNRNAQLAAEVFQKRRGIFGNVPIYGAGHSLGAVLTSLMAAENPRLFNKIILLDPVFFSPRMIFLMQSLSWLGLSKQHSLAKSAARRRNQWPSKEAAFSALRPRGVFKYWTDDSMWAYVNHAMMEVQGGVQLKCRPSLEAKIFSSTPNKLWKSIFSIGIPVRILYADKTFPFVRQSALRWSASKTNVSTQEVVGDHCFMQGTPEETAQLMKRFLID
ncbi:alpha/beta hydrolase [Pseudomonas sp. F1_0610]|uniref:alpha/beta hydrolase n=1 Tax=Pseudomonas sp. F1_0610 TaxID=3114284 RepID=UPI0039C454D4